MVFRKKSTNAKRPIRKKVYRKKPIVSKAVKSYVKRTISANIENKVHVDYAVNQSITTASGGSAITHRQLLPSLIQGVSSGQRIGNNIKVKSAVIRGSVNLLAYNITTNPVIIPAYVMVWVLRSKLKNQGFGASNAPHDLFDAGNSTVGPQGNLLDTMFPINSQSWICCYKRKIKLGATTNVSPVNGFADMSSYSVPFTISYGKHIKTLKYDDSTTGGQSIPVNTNLNIVFTCVSASGDNSSQYQMAEYHMTNTIIYEDA